MSGNASVIGVVSSLMMRRGINIVKWYKPKLGASSAVARDKDQEHKAYSSCESEEYRIGIGRFVRSQL